ncbi:hypothetical protein CDO22_34875 (plasmid) [Sinorhizobium meliloti]|nr:hypothetical protein CDO22_34875 [Sinorhizobium meliloti]
MVATPTTRRPALRITEAKVETALCFHAIEVLVHQPLAKVHHQIAKSGDPDEKSDGFLLFRMRGGTSSGMVL